MGGSERFWVGEYGGGGDLSKKLVFWKGIGFVVGLISGDRCVDWRCSSTRKVELEERS